MPKIDAWLAVLSSTLPPCRLNTQAQSQRSFIFQTPSHTLRPPAPLHSPESKSADFPAKKTTRCPTSGCYQSHGDSLDVPPIEATGLLDNSRAAVPVHQIL